MTDQKRRRTKAEQRTCSRAGCPGDGRYIPPGKAHLPDCPHDAVKWVWEEIPVTPEFRAREAIKEAWHHTGFYGRADLNPHDLDNLALVAAEVLAPLVTEREKQAAVEALREAADEYPDATVGGVAEGYLRARRWLRDRADGMEQK